jgi:hypothetical protein
MSDKLTTGSKFLDVKMYEYMKYKGRKYYAKQPTKGYINFLRDIHKRDEEIYLPLKLMRHLFPDAVIAATDRYSYMERSNER